MRLAIVCHVTGILVRIFSATLVAPAAVSAWYREWFDATGFVVAGVGAVEVHVGSHHRVPLREEARVADRLEHRRRTIS